jgi:hypothetical protein
MSKWVEKYDFDRECDNYFVTCSTLMDEDGYELGEYRISINSWRDDLYNKKYKVADSLSEHKYFMTFRDKNMANRVWKWITTKEPTYEQLKEVGFKKSTW